MSPSPSCFDSTAAKVSQGREEAVCVVFLQASGRKADLWFG